MRSLRTTTKSSLCSPQLGKARAQQQRPNAAKNKIKKTKNNKTHHSLKKKSTNNKCWRGCGEKGTLLHCWWECKFIQPLWRTVWRFLRKLKIELSYDLATPLLGIYPEKTIIQKDKVTSVGEDVEKLESLYTVGGNVKWCSHSGKQSSSFLLPHDPTTPLLSIYPEEWKHMSPTKICIQMLIAICLLFKKNHCVIIPGVFGDRFFACWIQGLNRHKFYQQDLPVN